MVPLSVTSVLESGIAQLLFAQKEKATLGHNSEAGEGAL